MRRIRIGIIGSGKIAEQHAKAYLGMDQVELVGVADVIPMKAKQFVDKLNILDCMAFDSHLELLKLKLDGVSICTPNYVHYSTAIDSLNAGTHVLVEKPLAVNLLQGIEMVRTAKKVNKILTVGYQPRYDPNMIKVKEIIQSGVLGDIYYVDVGGGRRRGMPGGTFINRELAGVGAMGDIGTYSLDLALNALGHPRPLTVSAYTSNHFGTNPSYHPESDRFEVEDFGMAMIRLEGDIILSMKTSWAMHMDSLGDAIFLGKDAGLKLKPSGTGPWSGVWDGGISTIDLFKDVKAEPIQETILVEKHNVDIFAEKVIDFVHAIQFNKSAPVPAEELIINQAVIDAIIRSSESKREVEVHIPEF